MLADPQALPALATIGTGKDLARRAGEHRFGAVDADGGVVDVGVCDASDSSPPFPTVLAAAHAVHLDAGPYQAVVRGVDRQRRHARDPHIRTLFGHLGVELSPRAPTIP